MKELKIKFKASILLFLGFMLTSGCSNQYRVSDAGTDWTDVESILNDIKQDAQSSGVSQKSNDEFFQMALNGRSTVFYSHTRGGMGPMQSVLSVEDLGFVDQTLAGVHPTAMIEANIFFVVDQDGTDAMSCALLVDLLSGQGDPITRSFICQSWEIVNGLMIMNLLGDDGLEIFLTSRDTDKNDVFKGAIQLKINSVDSEGNLLQFGQFSSLVGYGN